MYDLIISARFPLRRMFNNTGSDHIEIDVDHAAKYVPVCLYCCCMITIFPEGPFAIFALIVFLACPPCDQLHAFGDCVLICVNNQEMDVV